MPRLAVFDIDGTLTDTNDVDGECYRRAVAEVLSVEPRTLSWTDAPHVTDAALLRWFAERHARTLDAADESSIQARFVELLDQQLRSQPHRFGAIRGASSIRAALEARGWHLALATGGWAPSARLKLPAIGFDTRGLVMATASDAQTRSEIVRLAHQRAIVAYGALERVVSVGDAVWDVHTAVTVEWPFIGVASGEQAALLRACGASTVLPDLIDVSAVEAALDAAAIPRATIAAPVV